MYSHLFIGLPSCPLPFMFYAFLISAVLATFLANLLFILFSMIVINLRENLRDLKLCYVSDRNACDNCNIFGREQCEA